MGERYRDPAAPVDDRVDDLLGRMTVEEKVHQLGCFWVTSLVHDDRFDPDLATERLRHGIGHVTRIGASTGLRPAESAALMNDIQRVLVDTTRLGIPAIVHEESVGGLCARDATVFPTGLGLASTWDPHLVEQVGAVIREQMRAVGARLTLAPVLDVARDPRWGRVEETYGEDPVLAGMLGAAYVRGVQTDDLSQGVACTGKHFLGYALPEGGMNHAPVQLGPRELREVFAEPFAAAIRHSGLAAVMNSYSAVDGLPCAGSRAILHDLLREELGFEGVVVADYFSVDLLISHHRVAADRAEAAVMALSAGLDMELPSLEAYGQPLLDAIDRGAIGMDVVDEAVRRALRTKVRLGLFEQPYVDAGRAQEVYQTPAQRALARRAAAEAVVVLTNDGVLPIDPDSLATVAVIGPGADDRRLLQGDYHYPAHAELVFLADTGTDADRGRDGDFLPEAGGAFTPGPYYTPHVTPLAALTEALGADRVVHARGCAVTGHDASGLDEAAAAAAAADVAVVVVAGSSGLRPENTVGEFRDVTDLGLTGVQPDLVEAVAATGTPTVTVVLSGRVHSLTAEAERSSALVMQVPPGEEGGHGLADVLLGQIDASGRLPVTLPRTVGQVPTYAGHRWGGGRSRFLDDYVDSPASPLFPFGHGLSFTTFDHRDLRVTAASTADPVVVEVTTTNTGSRAGTDVVQLYVSDLVASVVRSMRQLVGFARVDLDPGDERRVTFTVHPTRLAFYDTEMRFVIEPGAFAFSVARSALDPTLTETVEITGEPADLRQSEVVATTVAITDAG